MKTSYKYGPGVLLAYVAAVSVYFRAKRASTRDALTREGTGQEDTEMTAPHVRVLLK